MNAHSAHAPPETENHRYRLIAPIARGGMAELYLAATHGADECTKVVALKRVWPELAHEPDFVAMFTDEARLAVRLNHPNVVQTFEVGRMDDRLFIAMEFLEGQTLNGVMTRLRDPDLFSLPLRLKVLSSVLGGLHYAHDLTDYDGTSLAVVHRDVCPQNVFVTYDGNVKLLDFGIAKSLAASHHTRPGVMKGRAAYMAPEQIRGEDVDRRADIFSVGVMLWEAAANRRFWYGETETSIIRKLASGAPIEVPPLPADLPAGLEDICRRALSTKRTLRYDSAEQMQADIDRLIAGNTDSYDRQLAAVVAFAFQEERQQIRSLIDRGLRNSSPIEPRRFTPLSEMQLPGTPAQDHVPTVAWKLEGATHKKSRATKWTAVAGLGVFMIAGLAWLNVRSSVPKTRPAPPVTAMLPHLSPTPGTERQFPPSANPEPAAPLTVAEVPAPPAQVFISRRHTHKHRRLQMPTPPHEDIATAQPTVPMNSDPFDQPLRSLGSKHPSRSIDVSNPYR